AEGRARIAKREAARAADPYLYDDWVRAGEPIGTSLMRKSDETLGLLYRTNENALVDAPQPDAGAENSEAWEQWLQRRLAAERDALVKGITEGFMTLLTRERLVYDRKLGELEGEIRELKGALGATLQLLGQKGGEVVVLPRKSRDVA